MFLCTPKSQNYYEPAGLSVELSNLSLVQGDVALFGDLVIVITEHCQMNISEFVYRGAHPSSWLEPTQTNGARSS